MNDDASYSPSRRTALLLSGSGTHGVYQAGVLKAFEEAGVKIDVVAAHGIGAGTAALAAIGGGSKLWDANGIWRANRVVPQLYGWKWSIRIARWLGGLVLVALLVPLIVLAGVLLVYLTAFLLDLVGTGIGEVLMARASGWLHAAFSANALPSLVPRSVTILVMLLLLVLVGGFVPFRGRGSTRNRLGWWNRGPGSPLEARGARRLFTNTIWRLIRGAASTARPRNAVLGRRYAEVLTENAGQPGFRELLVAATDLDARHDVLAVLLREPFRRQFLSARAGSDRAVETLDLAGAGQDHVMDIMAGALTLPLACEPYRIRYPADGYWRGETHRLCDRPGLVVRLLDELAAAGVTQVIVVSAVPLSAGPHHLDAPAVGFRRRIGEFMMAAESAALADALATARLQFESVHVVAPTYNPIGPLDFAGSYDRGSDRHSDPQELIGRGYEDAYSQFIEPVVGASGERLTRPERITSQ
jgi:hypothetical protein